VYDEALSKYDVLIMPTTPMRPTKIPSKDTSRLSLYIKALEMCGNTSAFNASGHPAMSVPCGMVNGLPIGTMIIGKYFDESTIYRLAYAFEQSFNWKELN
jgi:amidase